MRPLCWQARYLGALDLCRARAGGLAKRWQARRMRRLCWQARYLGPLDLCRARAGGLAKRWQARHMRPLCWQARYLGPLDLCRARARVAGRALGGSPNAGRRDACVVCAGRRGT